MTSIKNRWTKLEYVRNLRTISPLANHLFLLSEEPCWIFLLTISYAWRAFQGQIIRIRKRKRDDVEDICLANALCRTARINASLHLLDPSLYEASDSEESDHVWKIQDNMNNNDRSRPRQLRLGWWWWTTVDLSTYINPARSQPSNPKKDIAAGTTPSKLDSPLAEAWVS